MNIPSRRITFIKVVDSLIRDAQVSRKFVHLFLSDLAALADDLIAHHWNLKHLVRTIAMSRTYQQSSIPNASNRSQHSNFSHAALRRLSAEQLADAVSRATGVDEPYRVGPPGLRAVHVPYVAAGSRLLRLFGRPTERASACECGRSPDATLPQVMPPAGPG